MTKIIIKTILVIFHQYKNIVNYLFYIFINSLKQLKSKMQKKVLYEIKEIYPF